MRILIVEDDPNQRDIAVKLFGAEHSLTLAKNYTEAVNLLYPGQDREGDEAEPSRPAFDMVLTDVHIPLGNTKLTHGYQYTKDELNHELPDKYGFLIALIAFQNKIPKIGIVSSGNHHDGATGSALSMLKHTIQWSKPEKIRLWVSPIKDWKETFNVLTQRINN